VVIYLIDENCRIQGPQARCSRQNMSNQGTPWYTCMCFMHNLRCVLHQVTSRRTCPRCSALSAVNIRHTVAVRSKLISRASERRALSGKYQRQVLVHEAAFENYNFLAHVCGMYTAGFDRCWLRCWPLDEQSLQHAEHPSQGRELYALWAAHTCVRCVLRRGLRYTHELAMVTSVPASDTATVHTLDVVLMQSLS
jgi:hypothetical protein